MLMNVTAHQAFDDSKLIVWASRIIYEKPLAVAQNWLNSEVIVCNTTANPSSSAQLETASSISNSSSATLQPQAVVPSYSEPSRITASSTTCPVTSKPITKCLPNRNVCSYCKRIMVLSDDLDPKIVQMITSSSQTLPASIIYEGPIPFIGARGRSGVQPASPSGSDYSSSSSSQTATHTASSTTPVQLSIQGVTNHLWLSPHQYYNIANLDDNVTIYNGVCEVCYAEIGYLFFKRGTFANGMRVVAEESLGAEIKRLEVVEKQVEKEKLGAAFKSLKRGSGSAGGMEREEKKVRLIAPKPGSAVPIAVSDGPRSVF
ncbi:hypothetical protein HDU99_005618 [Rhizoclosmatium hyalinum]|nr:hypothetical protein HDU99_005618 [Rhizoclosmatium hyalinum]